MSKEKWNFQLYFKSEEADTERVKEKKDQLQRKSSAEIYEVSDLPKTKEERRIIKKAQIALDKVFADMRIPPPSHIKERNVHVLEPEKFYEIFGDEIGGKYSYGHIYLPRKEYINFIDDFIHELSHWASFYGLSVKHTDKKTIISLKKSGISFKSHNQKDFNFSGLNEAVTEMFAAEVRRRYTIIDKELNKDQKEDLWKRMAYAPHIFLLYDLVHEIAGENKKKFDSLIFKLFYDHLFGTYEFIKEIAKHNPNATKVLRKMNIKEEDVLLAAEELGFSDFEEKIKKLKTKK